MNSRKMSFREVFGGEIGKAYQNERSTNAFAIH